MINWRLSTVENIKAVIFDMDGVITETSEMHFIAWKKMAEQVDIEIDLKFNENLKGISRRESLLKILKHGNKANRYTEEEIKKLMFDKNEHYVGLISSYTINNLNPGIYDFMKNLKDNHIKIAIASASQSAPLLVKKLAIDSLVDFIVDPQTVAGKPAPDIFLQAAKILDVDIEFCVGIEDAVAGVEAIKSAGMYAVGIGSGQILNKADIIFKTTDLLTLERLKEA